MFRRFTLRPAMVPQSLSDYVHYQSYQALSVIKSNWLEPLQQFLTTKNLIDIRLSNLEEQVALYRPMGNQHMNARAMMKYCADMQKRLRLWDAQTIATRDALAQCRDYAQCVSLEGMLEIYIPQALAKIHMFTICALFAFDATYINFSPQLIDIYQTDRTYDKLIEILQDGKQCFEEWKEDHKNNPALVQAVSDLLIYVEAKLPAISPRNTWFSF